MGRIGVTLGCTLLSGFLFAAALPPSDWQPLGWICFVPLLASLKGQRLVFAVLAPIGMGLFAAWITVTGVLYGWPRLEGEESWHYAGFLLFSLAAAPAFLASACIKKASFWNTAALAAGFVCAESLLLLYLPAHLALTQYRSPVMLNLSSWIGIWGVSFLLYWFQLGVALNSRESYQRSLQGKRGWVMIGSSVGLVVAITWTYPDSPLRSEETRPGGGLSRVAAIQTPFPEEESLERWSGEAEKAGAGLVVWPELSAIGIAPAGDTEKLKVLSSAVRTAIVTTFSDGALPMPHNAAAVFLNGYESARYFKRKPFGGESKEHRAGTLPRAVQVGGRWTGLNICFDSCYPSVIRETAVAGPIDVLALPCMGPESPYGVIQAIHGAFTPFRSAELGIPIVRGESSAFAMITDSSGRIVAEAPPGFEGVIWGDVARHSRWTFVKAVGDWSYFACWGGLAVGIIVSASGRLRRREPV